ncbi:MAG: DPP IV N-terminal domain-containing protein, partial [candidate division WOR-3 bacterium]
MNILLLFTVLAGQLPTTLKFDPKLQWYTFETPHFSVHFATKSDFAKDEEFAKQIVWLAEDVHKKLVPVMRFQPKTKTNIIVADIYDEVSGWASPLPNNTIFICPFFPKTMRVNYYDWLKNLLIHEYTHILQINLSAKLNRRLQTIFGQIILPNAIMPTMFHEAYTIFNESAIGILGRANSTYYQMMLRAQILDNNLFPIDKCLTYQLAQYPNGETPYLYGGMFFNYLAEKYAKTKLIDYAHWYSGGLPLFYNVQAKRIFKKSFYQLWKEWQDTIKATYQAVIDQIKQKPITASQPITFEGFDVSYPVFANNHLYYVSINNHNYPALKQYDLNHKTTKTLLRKNISSPISISSDNQKLIFSIKEYYQNYYYYDDIYLYDLTTRKLQRLTKGERAFDPDFSPTENKIVLVKSELGQSNLYLLDLTTNEISQLTYREDFCQFAQPRFSPDGKKIAVAIWQQGGYQDIYLYDIATEWLIPITHDRHLDIEPCWTKDGKYLLFVSDRNRIFNIYAYSLEKKEIYQVTNVLTGAFSPAISNDNQTLAFLLYSSKGFDLHITRINLDSIALQQPISVSDQMVADEADMPITDTIKAELYHYRLLPSILPKFWLPIASYDNHWYFGGLTYGADALFQHQY